MGVGPVDYEGAAGCGPLGSCGVLGKGCGDGGGGEQRTVCYIGGFVYVGAGVDPLTRWFFEGATAPCGCEETEVSICARGEGGDCEEGSGQHDCSNS